MKTIHPDKTYSNGNHFVNSRAGISIALICNVLTLILGAWCLRKDILKHDAWLGLECLFLLIIGITGIIVSFIRIKRLRQPQH